jgi:hypothetical protein
MSTLDLQTFENLVPLTFSRVFLSVNPLVIEVFRAVADHPVLRHQITDIIWDDARFVSDHGLGSLMCPTIIKKCSWRRMNLTKFPSGLFTNAD